MTNAIKDLDSVLVKPYADSAVLSSVTIVKMVNVLDVKAVFSLRMAPAYSPAHLASTPIH